MDDKRFWSMSIEQGRHEQFTPPVYSWLPSIGPSALLQVGAIPVEWSGDLLLGSLKNGSLHRLRIVDERVVLEERIVVGERIRDMVQLSDGTLVLWTDAPRIIELAFAPAAAGPQLAVALTEEEENAGLHAEPE
jgi:glucose/arabinose dehydrogenase